MCRPMRCGHEVNIPLARTGLIALTLMILFLATESHGAHHVTDFRTSPTIISQVTVIDVATGQELRDRTIVIDGEPIRAVRVSTPDDTQAYGRHIEGRGKYLIPGLWDIHVHGNNDAWYADWFPLYIANGVTGVREMFGPEDADKFRAEARRQHIPVAGHVPFA